MWTLSLPSTPSGTGTALVAVFAVATLGVILRSYFQKAIAQNLPPGPPGDPIIGHALKVPASHQWTTFSDWARKYGMSSSYVCTRICIVIDGLSHPKEI